MQVRDTEISAFCRRLRYHNLVDHTFDLNVGDRLFVQVKSTEFETATGIQTRFLVTRIFGCNELMLPTRALAQDQGQGQGKGGGGGEDGKGDENGKAKDAKGGGKATK